MQSKKHYEQVHTLIRLEPPFSEPMLYFFSGDWNANSSRVIPRCPSNKASSTITSPEFITRSYNTNKHVLHLGFNSLSIEIINQCH